MESASTSISFMKITDSSDILSESAIAQVLLARLRIVFSNDPLYRRLLGCRGLDAQKVLDTFQWLLDLPEMDDSLRRNLIVATQRLSKKSGLYPARYMLENVVQEGQHPVIAGGFADIYKGYIKGQAVALKVIRVYQRTEAGYLLKHISKEAILWGQLSHPNVLPIYGLGHSHSQICLVAPWMENGDVTDYLEENPGVDRVWLVIDVAYGLQYLHRNGIIHGDLKGPNILIDKAGRARLADFGLSSVSDPEILAWSSHSSAASKGGSVPWQAPELFDVVNDAMMKNSEASDVYAWSCVCYEIFTGSIPFPNITCGFTIMLQVKLGVRPTKPPLSSPSWLNWGLSESIWELMQDCWRENPQDRPSIMAAILRVSMGHDSVDSRPSENEVLLPAQFRKNIWRPLDLLTATSLDLTMDNSRTNIESQDEDVANNDAFGPVDFSRQPIDSSSFIFPSPQVDDRAWDVRFKKGATLRNWTVLLIRDGNNRDEFASISDPELTKTMKGFADMCKNSGMNVNNDPPVVVECNLPAKDIADPTRVKAINAIRDTLTSLTSKPNFVLVLLPNRDRHVHRGLKHLCDSYLDLANVCVHSAKIRKEKWQLQYFANVALKVNMKLGGVNYALDQANMNWLTQMPTMLMGIDVTHPDPGSVKGTPSIAAVVASCDTSFAQYPASMEIQETKKKMVTNLAKLVWERLTLFQKKNDILPQRILVYRADVLEGQFQIVVGEELPAIRKACAEFDTSKAQYRPKITIVICGKHCHTCFFRTEQENADKDGNPKPGTVVDRGVTAVYHFDFFLQGTTRATHYYVVHDDIGFKADELQRLTNAVSYVIARATNAVSLVSPAYYAHLACERGRCYLYRFLQGIDSSAGSTRSGPDAEEQVFREATQMWHGGVSGSALKDTMFYV